MSSAGKEEIQSAKMYFSVHDTKILFEQQQKKTYQWKQFWQHSSLIHSKFLYFFQMVFVNLE